MADVFKADIEMLVGKNITVNGFRFESVGAENLTGTVIEGVADGVAFEAMTFSKVLTEYLEKVPKSWFPFQGVIVKRTSDAGFDYYAFGRKA